ncbi:MAG: Polyhydroxyalkanoic acid synthase [Myxococcaceae bacterium]|nr:Polyhydroxyalkanoic acid synthase [Myxococcaceae bacterium]
MILQTEIVDQAVDGERRERFIKEVIAARDGTYPIGMVRKRLLSPDKPGAAQAADAPRRSSGSLPPPTAAPCRAAILLIHGFGQNRYTWHTSRRSFANFLAAEGFDVFNLDLRGRGRSRRFGALQDTIIDDYIREDVPAAIRTVLRVSGQSQVFLVGHSMGGIIGYAVAGSTMREEVAGVVSFGSPYRFGLGSRFLAFVGPLLYAARLTGIFDRNPPIPIRKLGAHMVKRRWLWDNPLIPIPMRPWTPRSMEPEILAENLSAAFEHTRVAIALGLVGLGSESALKSHDGLNDYGLAFELADKPLLVIAGTRDALAPPASVRPVYDQSRSSDKTYREFPLGHIDMLLGRDAPQTVWPLVKTWLTARAARARDAQPALQASER